MIRFEQQQIDTLQMDSQRVGNVSEIGCDPNLDALRGQGVADWVHRIVRNGKARDLEIANREATSCLEGLEYWYRFAPVQEWGSTLCQIDRNGPVGSLYYAWQATGVVVMLMRHDDRVQRLDVFAYGCQSFGDLAAAQTGIHQDTRPVGANERRVPGTAAREYADLYDTGPSILSDVIPDSESP